jgi:hypothetical protein
LTTTDSGIRIAATVVAAIAATTAGPTAGFAQVQPASTRLVEVRTTVLAPDSVTVGERFSVRHTFFFPDTVEMNVPDEIDPGTCRVLALTWSDGDSGDRIERRADFTLITLDLQEARLPAIAVEFYTPDGDTLFAFADEVSVPVRQIAGEGANTRPLKEQWVAPRSYWMWIVAGAALVAAAALLIWWLRRRARRVEEAPPEPVLPPDFVALTELTRIDKMELLRDGQFKKYYTLVVEAVRRYVEARFQVDAMDRTTTELLDELARRRRRVEKLDGLLGEADLVKFAKYVPSVETATAAMSTAREIVVKTTPRRIIADDVEPVAAVAGTPGAIGDGARKTNGGAETG